ncbi:PASTA domain-containing protein [Mycolicibacterium mageritense]|nr:PASTA domain-containing protein [Mycolicibacterium mageritense]
MTSISVLTSASPAPTPIVMPNLVGQLSQDALSKLNSLGWTGVIDKGPDVPGDPRQRYRIVVQSPAPGEQLNSDGRIMLQFGA